MSGSTVRIADPLDVSNWDEQVLRLPGCTFFYSSAWARVLSESYGYKPTYFTFSEGRNLTGIVPVMDVKSMLTGRRGVSLPFTDFCEPIISDDLQPQDVLKHITSCGRDRGWKYIELRGGKGLLPDAQPSTVFWGHTLNLSSGEDKVFSSLKDSTRRNIKKAIKEGVEVKTLRSLTAVKDFYKLNCMTRKQHGLPPQPYRFFRKVYEQVIAKGLGFVSLAYFQNEPIAGNMYFHFGEKAIYKYGASDPRHQGLRASNLAMWEGIRWCCRNGCKELHLGRTDTSHAGLRRFKMGWGPREYSIGYFRYDLRKGGFVKDSDSVTSFHKAIFSRTPISLLKIAGSLLYGHMA